ncbi:MAG: class C sortase [Lachnospiraceae bacterium]|nr:class C sortase [Lachnospiraceae bacterium]
MRSNSRIKNNTKGQERNQIKKTKTADRKPIEKNNNRALFVFCLILFLSGVVVLLYPYVSNAVNQRHASQAIQDFDEKIANMDKEEIDVIKEAAKQYNEQLQKAVSAGDTDSAVSYKDISGIEKVIGYIVIPKIDVNLPIYSGTSKAVLKKGVGHMEQTSYPLGGISTHCVLTGHRGLPSAVLFTDLDKVEIGDGFYLHVLDEVLAYKVDKIKVVEPDNGDDLEIVEGQDYCTLVTCTPYAVNSHRLLVRGTRVEYIEGEITEDGLQMQSGSFTKRIIDVWPWLLIAFFVISGIETFIFMMILKKRKKEKEEEQE